MTERLWGRLQADVDVRLRRGAWYKVLKAEGLEVVIEVNRQPCLILKALLEISSKPPVRWSVVPKPKRFRPPSGTAPLGDRYGVCPSCNERAALPKRADRHRCPHCRREYEVAWDEAYLS
jgi:hypothetical protein